jgi:WD40 repeat protein
LGGSDDFRSFEWYYWNRLCHSELRTLKGHSQPVSSVAFSPDGKRLASGSWDETLKLWDAANGQEILTFKGHSGAVFCVAFGPDGKRLASGSSDRAIKLWDASSGQEVLTLKGHSGPVLSVAFSPDGKRLASGSDDHTLKLWDAASGQEILTLDFELRAAAALLDLAHGLEILTFKGHSGWVSSVAFSPDGKRLASGSHYGGLKLWDAASGQEILTLTGLSGPVYSVDFDSVDFDSVGVNSVAFSPDGKRLASGSFQGALKLWDAVSGQEILTFKGHSGRVDSVAFSPDGKRLASGSHYGGLKLWDASSGQEILTLKGHSAAVLSVAFGPDGKRLASGADDGTVKLFDARPWTAELRTEREALGLVIFLSEKGLSKEAGLKAIATDGTITDLVRQRGLELAPLYWDRLEMGAAVGLVDSLLAKLLLKEEVFKAVAADTTITPTVRRRALELAEQATENAAALNHASWSVVRQPGLPQERYQLALRQAQAAVRIEPEHGFIVNTLGVALYRVGKYQEALESLTRSDQLNSKGDNKSLPADLAFLAMAHQKLGHHDEAKKFLSRLREALADPKRRADAESQAFLREAETLIEGKPAQNAKK